MKIKIVILILLIISVCLAGMLLQGCRFKPDTKTPDTEPGNDSAQATINTQAMTGKESDLSGTEILDPDYSGYEENTENPGDITTAPEAEEQKGKAVNLGISYHFDIPGNTNKIEFTTVIPDDYKLRQVIKNIDYSIEPSEVFSSNYTKYAKFIILEPGNDFNLDINIDMEIFDYDLEIATASVSKNNVVRLSGQDNISYTAGEKNIDTGEPAIINAASKFKETDQLKLIRQIYDFVLDSLYYQGYNPGDCGAAGALAKSGGDCTEYSDLFVTLCRVKGIPARVVEGYTTDAMPAEISMGHNWSEIFIDGFGWVPFDCIFDDNNGDLADTTFYNLKDVYIYNSFIRNDPKLLGFHYYAYYYYGDEISVEKSITINS